jgi:hypothetical protein
MTQKTATSSRKPSHRLYRVTGEGKSAHWTPIGAAWPNKDGQGFSISCDAVSLEGRILLRIITDKPEHERRGVRKDAPIPDFT